MYLEVYPDVAFMLDFILDFILLFLLRTITKKQCRIVRLLGAAAMGGLFSIIYCMLPWLTYHFNIKASRMLYLEVGTVCRLMGSVFMILFAYGRLQWKVFLRQLIYLYLITYFVGGFINAIYYHTNARLYLLKIGNYLELSTISFPFVVITAVCLVPLAGLLLRVYRTGMKNQKEIYEVELKLWGKECATHALYDSGNCLYDPIRSSPVIIIEQRLLKELLSTEEETQFLDTMGYLEYTEAWKESECYPNQETLDGKLLLRLRYIPYRSVGREQGLMLGLVLDGISVHHGKEILCSDKITAAVSAHELSTRGEYHVILHKDFFKCRETA